MTLSVSSAVVVVVVMARSVGSNDEPIFFHGQRGLTFLFMSEIILESGVADKKTKAYLDIEIIPFFVERGLRLSQQFLELLTGQVR